MIDTILVRSFRLLSLKLNPQNEVEFMANAMICCACLSPLFLIGGLLPYGRYSGESTGKLVYIKAKLGWIMQEIPSFAIPLCLFATSPKLPSLPAFILLFMFTFHYGHRVFVYSFSIKGEKPTPLAFFTIALLFCTCNGYMQSVFLLYQAHYPISWLVSWNFILGSVIFVFGLYTNICCDNILLNLRKPGETGYKIPRGFMFEYVSGGNYFGEVTEWIGWALACWSTPSFSFAVFAAMFLGSRSYSHHHWYLKKFPDYPKNRKIIIPYVL